MPAMSPTMTEGNIASWKIKEGDKYATGDVLLEIETDKAQMDVEAQEDGQLAKILQEAGAKGVKVGSRIAIIAEEEDDLSTLELPAEEPPETSKPPPSSTESEPSHPKAAAKPSQPSKSSSPSKPQTYPLYPSVAQLLKQSGLSISEADKIPASGPKGRLLKGDVLSYLGNIENSYSSEQSARITKLGHLDLSNIQPAPQKTTAPATDRKPEAHAAAPEPEPPSQIEVTLPISLSSALSVQKRVKEGLGIDLPLSTFIARATELANEDLPSSLGRKPTAEELFNDVLGLNNGPTSKTSRGRFIPQIETLISPSSPTAARLSGYAPDIYDLLTGKSSQISSKPSTAKQLLPSVQTSSPVFSVTAIKGDEKRARIFLERVKTILQVDAGRLIL